MVISSSFACVFCTTSGQELSELPQLEWKPTQIPHLSTLFFSSCDDSNQHRWRLFKGHTKALEILAQHGVQWQQGHIASRNKRLKRKWNFKIQPTIPSQNVECSQQWSLEKKRTSGSWTMSRWLCLSLSCSRDVVNSKARAKTGVSVALAALVPFLEAMIGYDHLINLLERDTPK